MKKAKQSVVRVIRAEGKVEGLTLPPGMRHPLKFMAIGDTYAVPKERAGLAHSCACNVASRTGMKFKGRSVLDAFHLTRVC